MLKDLTNDKSRLIQVMAWWCQAITWITVDKIQWHYVSSQGHNELNLCEATMS